MRNILIGVAALMVTAGIGYGVWLAFFAPPTSADYKTAATNAESISEVSALDALESYQAAATTAIQEGKKQDALIADIANKKQATEAALVKRQEYADKIADSRVMRDDEVQKLADTYLSTEKKYAAYVRDDMAAYPYFLSSLYTCQKTFDIESKAGTKGYAEVHKQASVDCLADLNKLTSSPITPFADYATEFKRIIAGRQKIFDDVAADKTTLIDALDDIRAFAEASRKNNPVAGYKQYIKDNSFQGTELKDLYDLLEKKAAQA